MNARPQTYAPSPSRRQVIQSSLLLISLEGCGDSSALDGLPPGRQAQVTDVRSGDTIEVDGGEIVRLVGIEASRPNDAYGGEALDALAGLVDGRKVELLFGGARTSPYGATLAHLRTVEHAAWVQGALIDRGAARVHTYADNRALARPMLAREARARAVRRGLWALDDYRVRLPRELDPEGHGLVIVEGRVARVGRSGQGGAYLDFEQDWRNGLSVEVTAPAMRDFRSARLDPMALEGRLLRIRSDLKPGLRLVLDHPEQVEALRG